ncbi:MAG: TGS domain-containing protein [Candidatus Bathyarchaeota archaeon]|nr:MAG: TGS domain-containing protein [Candidatus Bathyarchaeota archaeon]
MPEPYAVMREKIRKRLQNKTDDQRIRELKQVLSELHTIYKELRVELTQELSDLTRKRVSRASIGKSRYPAIQKARPQLAIVSFHGSNARPLFQKLSGRRIGFDPQIYLGRFDHRDVAFQLLLIPEIYEGTADDDRELMSIIRATDGLLIFTESEKDLLKIIAELRKAKIHVNLEKGNPAEKGDEMTRLPSLVVYKEPNPTESATGVQVNDVQRIKDEVYKRLGLTRIYLTKTNRDGFSLPPLVFMQDIVSVEDVLTKIARTSKSKFRHAKVWGASAKFDGETFGLRRLLSDGDIVRIYGI